MLTSKLQQQIFNRNFPHQIVKFLTTAPSSTSLNLHEFTPVYTFPYITSFALINKAKLYQTLGTCIALPCSYALSTAELCSHEVFAGIAALGITGCALFHTLGFMTSNTVGIIYLHKNKQAAKVSYLDTWGSRRDTIIELKDIVPFYEQPMAITDPLYLKLQKYTSKDKLKLNVKYGKVLDTQKFATIFSKIE